MFASVSFSLPPKVKYNLTNSIQVPLIVPTGKGLFLELYEIRFIFYAEHLPTAEISRGKNLAVSIYQTKLLYKPQALDKNSVKLGA